MLVKLNDIIDLFPDTQTLVVKGSKEYLDMARNRTEQTALHYMLIDVHDQQEFSKYKFEVIKKNKANRNPSQRIMDFEWRDENNLPDFDKRDKLIESRKTIAEKRLEIKTLSRNIEDYKSIGLECLFLEEQLKEKLRRGIL